MVVVGGAVSVVVAGASLECLSSIYYVFINKNKKRGRGKKRSETGEKRKEEEARREEVTYMSFSASIFISAMLRLGVGGVAGSFSFSLFVSEWRRLAEG